jgi:hypothetical protein
MDEAEPVPLEIHEIAFDALDPYSLARFWALLLGRQVRAGSSADDDSALVVEAPGQPGLLFTRVPQGKRAKNRVHLDLWPTRSVRDAEIGRALGIGATLLADRREPKGPGWVVLADPEGNEFCIGSSSSERSARSARLSD